MGDDRWAAMFDDMVRAFETGSFLTVFEQRGKVGRLPDALGGDWKRWPALAAAANASVSKNSFFELLQAKAHFLMLPKPIVAILKESSSVKIDENVGAGQAYTSQFDYDPPEARMHIPNAGTGLASVGYNLGRPPTTLAVIPTDYNVLDSIYHEMTHAWLWVQPDAEIQKLHRDGARAYTPAVGVNGTPFDPYTAFTEAAAYYVGHRVLRWCKSLAALDILMRAPLTDSDRATKLQAIVADYEKDNYDDFDPTYGAVAVDTGDNIEEKISQPPLSKPLRDAIDKKILDGRPLTKPFADTPLVSLRDAVMSP